MFFRFLNVLMALNFLFSAVVQINDPDPVRWMSIYGAAFLITLAAVFQPRRVRWFIPVVIFVLAAAWSLSIAPREVGRFAITDLFKSWEMKNAVVEEAREMLGLAITAAWMLVLAIARWRAEQRMMVRDTQ